MREAAEATGEAPQERDERVSRKPWGIRACDVCGLPVPAPTRRGGRPRKRHTGNCQRLAWRRAAASRRAPGRPERLRTMAAALRTRAAALEAAARLLEEDAAGGLGDPPPGVPPPR